MSSDLTSLIWRNPNLTSNKKLIMLALADYAGATGQIFPSLNHLVIKTGLHKNTVRSIIKSCIEESYLAKKQQFKLVKTGGVAQTSNAYKINYKKLMDEANAIKEVEDSDWSTDVFHNGTPCKQDNPPTNQCTHPLPTNVPAPYQPMYPNSSLNSSSNSSVDSKLEEELLELGFGNGQIKLMINRHGSDRVREGVEVTKSQSVINPRGFLSAWLAARVGATNEMIHEARCLDLEYRQIMAAVKKADERILGAN